MFHQRSTLLTIGAALLAAVTTSAQERTAIRVSIGGAPLPPQLQVRAIVEQQRGTNDEARIQVAGVAGLAYAAGIGHGDRVEIGAIALNGASVPLFSGTVVSLEYGSRDAQPFVVIRAFGDSPRDGREARESITLVAGPEGDSRVLAFAPRLSASSSIQELLVIGTDAATGDPLAGRAVAPTVVLGAGSDAPFGRRVEIATAQRFASVEEANAFAAAALSELLEARISAEVATTGTPDLRPGSLVDVRGVGTPLDGAYYVSAVSHQFGSDSYGGYSSAFRLRRADLGMFRISAIDDEVLVAFEHGDFDGAYVVGSFWDCAGGTDGDRSEDDRQCRVLRWPW